MPAGQQFAKAALAARSGALQDIEAWIGELQLEPVELPMLAAPKPDVPQFNHAGIIGAA